MAARRGGSGSSDKLTTTRTGGATQDKSAGKRSFTDVKIRVNDGKWLDIAYRRGREAVATSSAKAVKTTSHKILTSDSPTPLKLTGGGQRRGTRKEQRLTKSDDSGGSGE